MTLLTQAVQAKPKIRQCDTFSLIIMKFFYRFIRNLYGTVISETIKLKKKNRGIEHEVKFLKLML